MNTVADFPALANSSNLKQIEIDYDPETLTMYWWMKPSPRPCFNAAFLEESFEFERRLQHHQGWMTHAGKQCKIENAVFGSRVPGVFNLGGDLSLFIQAILRKDRDALMHYGNLCVDNMYRRVCGFDAEIATYSLIQGRAFGGGFECALASDVIVAERGATMSFPEVLFNMFPGMGALSLLARKIGLRKAEEIIMSGKVFTAKEMCDLGVVDELTETGTGLNVVQALIKTRRRKRNSYRAMALAKRQFQPVTHAEMKAVVDIWVDAALRLETRDLRMMARLVRAQDNLITATSEDQFVEELYAPSKQVING
jgi:DSF synthase